MSLTLSQGNGFIMEKDMQRLNPRRAVIGAIGGALVEVLGNSGAFTSDGHFLPSYKLYNLLAVSQPASSHPQPPFTSHTPASPQASALTQGSAFGCIVSK
jgi:hypothetical protein